MSAEPATVLGHSVERRRGTVHALFRTDRGAVALRFTPADAHLIGGELRVASIAPVGERAPNHATAAAQGQPLEKPGGGIG